MEEVRKVLLALGLAAYTDAFEASGYDDLNYVSTCDADDLVQECGMKVGHAKKLLKLFVQYGILI